ncbi:NAD(P)H-dependent oxidoreductase, partial [Clostridium perfringens]|nr:NAD(P)H-dependent oxidoreductase [Clostridium perfringens]
PKKTFDAALRDATVASLEKQGCKVTVSDLMAQRFNPVLSINDSGDFDRDEFDYVEDLGAALQKGIIAEDIRKEQEKVKAADLIIFHYQTLLHDIP